MLIVFFCFQLFLIVQFNLSSLQQITQLYVVINEIAHWWLRMADFTIRRKTNTGTMLPADNQLSLPLQTPQKINEN